MRFCAKRRTFLQSSRRQASLYQIRFKLYQNKKLCNILFSVHIIHLFTDSIDSFSCLACNLFFKESEDEVDLRIWNIVTVSAGKNYALNIVNSLNANWKYAKFVFDESDNTIQAEMDMFVNKEHCGEEIFKAMRKLFVVIDTDEIAEQLHSLE